MPKIEFISPYADFIEQPKPALLSIPETYKKLSKRLAHHDVKDATVKACMPFLDALTTGYTLSLPVEVCFKTTVTEKEQEIDINFELIYGNNFPEKFRHLFKLVSHNDDQMPDDMKSKYRSLNKILKMDLPWHIKTPPGYSCLFTNPFNRNSPFKIIDGIVDTDLYGQNVNYPFYWTGDIYQKETWIPKGFPFVLVVPFKRESWNMKVTNDDCEKESFRIKFSNFVRDRYKKLIWQKKSFR